MSGASSVPVPPHEQELGEGVQGDRGGHFPDVEKASRYADEAVGSAYGADRVRAVRHLIERAEPSLAGGTVVDFGGGDGAFLAALDLSPSRVFLIDTSPFMLELAAPRLAATDLRSLRGSVDQLASIPSASVDLVLAINAMNYLSDQDRATFLKESSRVLRPGGSLIVLAGNELIDLYALNSGTAAFMRRNFGDDVAELLVDADAELWRNADRENPLRFGAELRGHGLIEVDLAFSQWHELSPGVAARRAGGDLLAARSLARNHDVDPNLLDGSDRWQAYFRCSMFASRSVRQDTPA